MLEALRRERAEALAAGKEGRKSWLPPQPAAFVRAPEEGDGELEEETPTSPGVYPEWLLQSLRCAPGADGGARPSAPRDTLVSKRTEAPTYLLTPPLEPQPPLPSSFAPRLPLLPPPPRDPSELETIDASVSSYAARRDPMAAVVAGLAIVTLAALSFVGRTAGDRTAAAQTPPAAVRTQGFLAGGAVASLAASRPNAPPAEVEILEPAPVSAAAPSATSAAAPRTPAVARPPVSPGLTRSTHGETSPARWWTSPAEPNDRPGSGLPKVSALQDSARPTAEPTPRVEGHRLFGTSD